MGHSTLSIDFLISMNRDERIPKWKTRIHKIGRPDIKPRVH